jgi:glucose-6-phosphate dehydrogenase assembly protein OpcA
MNEGKKKTLRFHGMARARVERALCCGEFILLPTEADAHQRYQALLAYFLA